MFTCVFDYAVGAYLARDRDERRRRIAFVASVAVQLSLLSTFKYAGWLSTELAGVFAVLGIGLSFAPLALPLPPTGLADTVLRLSAVLVLGGIAIVLLSRDPARAIVTSPEAPTNVPPSV